MGLHQAGLLSPEQLNLLTELTISLSKEQQIWVSGYIAGFSVRQTEQPVAVQETASSVAQTALTILYGSRTGNGEGLAKKSPAIG